MKRFFLSILCVSIFFLGLGALVEKTGARFKSDERALDLVRKARLALGGDAALASVQSLRIVGQTTRTVKIDGVERQHQGDVEIAMQLPDKFMKMVKIGKDDSVPGEKQVVEHKMNVVVVTKDGEAGKVAIDNEGSATSHGVRKIVIKKPDGSVEELTGDEADKVVIRDMASGMPAGENKHVFVRKAGDHSAIRQNELLRTTLGLLMTAPQGLDVSYTFGGEMSVEGTACNIVVAEFGGTAYRIYLDRSSNLPVMMAYTAPRMPHMFTFKAKHDAAAEGPVKDVVVLRKTAEEGVVDMAEFTLKFSDYRSVNGIQLPYKWTQTVAGVADETLDVTSYEINPANIAEKFSNQKVWVKTTQPE